MSSMNFVGECVGREASATSPPCGDRLPPITVRSGLTAFTASYVVASGQAYRFYGTDLRDSEYFTPRGADEFERFVIQRDSRFDRVVSARSTWVEPVNEETRRNESDDDRRRDRPGLRGAGT